MRWLRLCSVHSACNSCARLLLNKFAGAQGGIQIDWNLPDAIDLEADPWHGLEAGERPQQRQDEGENGAMESSGEYPLLSSRLVGGFVFTPLVFSFLSRNVLERNTSDLRWSSSYPDLSCTRKSRQSQHLAGGTCFS